MLVVGIANALVGNRGTTIVPPLETVRRGPIQSLQWCADQVLAGNAAAFFAVNMEAQDFLLNNGGCKNFAYSPALKNMAATSVHLSVGNTCSTNT